MLRHLKRQLSGLFRSSRAQQRLVVDMAHARNRMARRATQLMAENS